MAPSGYGHYGKIENAVHMTTKDVCINTVQTAPHQPDVASAIESLRNSVQETEKVLRELLAAIEPVCQLPSPANAETPPVGKDPMRCAVACTIDSEAYRLDQMREAIYDAIRRLQL